LDSPSRLDKYTDKKDQPDHLDHLAMMEDLDSLDHLVHPDLLVMVEVVADLKVQFLQS